MTPRDSTCGESNGKPQSRTEITLAGLWARTLQVSAEQIAYNSNYFSLGGDSLSVMTLLFLIGEHFNVELGPVALIDAPTLRDLAALIDAGMNRGDEQRG